MFVPGKILTTPASSKMADHAYDQDLPQSLKRPLALGCSEGHNLNFLKFLNSAEAKEYASMHFLLSTGELADFSNPVTRLCILLQTTCSVSWDC